MLENCIIYNLREENLGGVALLVTEPVCATQSSVAFKFLAFDLLVCYRAVVPNRQPFFSVEYKTFNIVSESLSFLQQVYRTFSINKFYNIEI